MTLPNDVSLRYRIMVRGECDAFLASAIDAFQVESCERGMTSVLVALRDESEFYGLLDRLQDLALHIVSINELGANGEVPGSM